MAQLIDQPQPQSPPELQQTPIFTLHSVPPAPTTHTPSPVEQPEDLDRQRSLIDEARSDAAAAEPAATQDELKQALQPDLMSVVKLPEPSTPSTIEVRTTETGKLALPHFSEPGLGCYVRSASQLIVHDMKKTFTLPASMPGAGWPAQVFDMAAVDYKFLCTDANALENLPPSSAHFFVRQRTSGK